MNQVSSEDTVQYRVAVDSNEDDALAELLMLTKHVARHGSSTTYRNSADQLHRIWGPAIIVSDGTVHWYRAGVRHRSDGPASEYSSGDCYWFQNGKLHRTDGPAMILADGRQWWHLDGKSMTEDEWRQHVTERYND